MTSTRVPALPTNLKERIAAIEQKVGNGGPSSRSVSPTPGVGSITSTNAGALRDKIAKFEGKGGIPVPRSRFGLGAPPTSQAPQRNGELYGNRIPAPARSVSNGVYPASRAASPTGDMSSHTSPGDRRSFSLSSVISDDDHMDYTPVGSPTFAFPLDSPEYVLSVPTSPEASPSLGGNGDAATFTRSIDIVRATSFQKALEIARNAESAKLEALDSAATPLPRLSQLLDEENDVEVPEPTPVIVVSSDETDPVVVHNSPTLETTPPVVVHDSAEDLSHPEPPLDVSLPQSQPSHEIAEVGVTEPTVSAITPPIVEQITPAEQRKESTPVVPVVLEVAPLSFRKRRPTISRQETEPIPSSEPLPELPIASVQRAQSLPQVSAVASPPSPVIAAKSDTPPRTTSPSVELPQTDVSAPSEPDPAISEPPKVDVNEDLPSVKLTPPEIVVHDEQPVSEAIPPPNAVIPESQQNDFNSRKAALTLDSNLINNNESLMSPPLATGMSGVSLTDLLSNYFTGGIATGTESKFGETTTSTAPPPLPSASPLSPPATLAYDNPESPPLNLSSAPIPIPAARPRHKTPDPLSFLSPPPSGMLSASPSASAAGSSMGSMSTNLSSRPMSMIETSPSRVTRAMRMTPATSRGVPMFVPGSARPKKSDFVYFPPTPDADEAEFGEFGEGEGSQGLGSGVISMHKASQSLSEGTRRGEEQDVFGSAARQATSFTAVVHGKVREASATMPSMRRYAVPETPQMKRVKRQTMAEPPLSPGQGELAALLQEAMWLEDTLSKGELPTEIVQQMEVDERERAELEAIEEEMAEKARTKEEEEERKRIACATAQLQAKRDEPTTGKLKHTFLIPLAKARSVHRSEGSTSSKAENLQSRRVDEEALRPKSAGVPDKSTARAPKTPLPTAGPSQSQSHIERPATPVTPDNAETAKPGELSSKSPKSSRFAGFRRLGSISRPSTMYGSSSNVRHSNSTSSEISSEDSQAVATPPEAHLEFGMKYLPATGQYGTGHGHSNGSTTSFPSLSPKKSGNNLGRAASFAEKMWSRARTKSSASNLSLASDVTVDDVPRLPAFTTSPALEMPSLPSLPVVVPPSPERKSNLVLQPPRRSTSLKRSGNLPPIPIEPVPPMPPMPTTFHSHSRTTTDASEVSGDSLLSPSMADSSRPTSWTSLSSAGSLGSLPSPLFDKEFIDAFPSVPGSTPMPNFITASTAVPSYDHFPHRRDGSNSSSVFAKPSFDSALLSSAIHLASAHKSAAAPSTTTLYQPSSRGSTPTAMPVPLPRPSGESAR